MVVVLVALFLAQLGGGLYDVLFSNYLSDVLHLDAEQRGFMELPRELPGPFAAWPGIRTAWASATPCCLSTIWRTST